MALGGCNKTPFCVMAAVLSLMLLLSACTTRRWTITKEYSPRAVQFDMWQVDAAIASTRLDTLIHHKHPIKYYQPDSGYANVEWDLELLCSVRGEEGFKTKMTFGELRIIRDSLADTVIAFPQIKKNNLRPETYRSIYTYTWHGAPDMVHPDFILEFSAEIRDYRNDEILHMEPIRITGQVVKSSYIFWPF
jgi:hypothetical protein